MSNLINAYKRSEVVDPASGLALFTLESRVVDSPEPAESLRASVVWSAGLDDASITLDPMALGRFERDTQPEDVSLLTGRPGAYLLSSTLELMSGEETSWHIVSDVALDHVAVIDLRDRLASDPDVYGSIAASLAEATESLVRIMAPADGLQMTGDGIAAAHQVANVTYNVMRGGVPLSGYVLETEDFAEFLKSRNRMIAQRHKSFIESLPEALDKRRLLSMVEATADPQLRRLAGEYLPFSFSRRHGDPSRPWNTFEIRVRDQNGTPIIYYEGNWRDVFQNWEALAMSFPEYLPDMISVFVNASTADGFNPYRISSIGIDWETPDPDDPWAGIGYWGDHQIVYLLRLLEAADRYLPDAVGRLLTERWFSYADVPYRLAPHDEIVDNPKATITFDQEAAARSAARVAELGSDGKLLAGDGEEPYLVNLLEKLLVPALAKLSYFVPGGGIWMNTQRPEWNDANNALVGFGLSMVTLYQLRRYLEHFRSLLDGSGVTEFQASTEVTEWMSDVTSILQRLTPDSAGISDRQRKMVVDELGQTFSDYRHRVYEDGFSGMARVSREVVFELCNAAMGHLDDTIRSARRPDGLYHSYNLISFSSDAAEAKVEHLHEMLEGQVAILHSGMLSPEESVEVIDALFSSAMYSQARNSFILYPERRPPSFLDKNVIPGQAISDNPLLSALDEASNRALIAPDASGRYRFNAELTNRDDVLEVLGNLAAIPEWTGLVDTHGEEIIDMYEQVFEHHSYTGRSGSMYGYEGIGSIYWHMVAKLLLAIQDSALEANSSGASPTTVKRLVDSYWRVRSGLGFNKTAREFGAIPIDPYSHTPAHAGAQQPGMTGLVKEELLTRPLELGIRFEDGMLRFDPLILRRRELLTEPDEWRPYNISLEPLTIELDEGSFGMTVCQVPIVLSTTRDEPRIEVFFTDGSERRIKGMAIDRETSAELFSRSGAVWRINAFLHEDSVG